MLDGENYYHEASLWSFDATVPRSQTFAFRNQVGGRDEIFEFHPHYVGLNTPATTPLLSELSSQSVCTSQHTDNDNMIPAFSHFTGEPWPQRRSTFESGTFLDLNVPPDLDYPHYGAFDPMFHGVNFLGHFTTRQNEVASGAMRHEMSIPGPSDAVNWSGNAYDRANTIILGNTESQFPWNNALQHVGESSDSHVGKTAQRYGPFGEPTITVRPTNAINHVDHHNVNNVDHISTFAESMIPRQMELGGTNVSSVTKESSYIPSGPANSTPSGIEGVMPSDRTWTPIPPREGVRPTPSGAIQETDIPIGAVARARLVVEEWQTIKKRMDRGRQVNFSKFKYIRHENVFKWVTPNLFECVEPGCPRGKILKNWRTMKRHLREQHCTTGAPGELELMVEKYDEKRVNFLAIARLVIKGWKSGGPS